MTEVFKSEASDPGAAVTLSKRSDFVLGNATVRPSRRQVAASLGTATGEPRVIQVLVALADAQGAVLSRDDLLRICWGGRFVGDDAINRAVAEVRKVLIASGANFEIETVPRVGYRIAGLSWQCQPTSKIDSTSNRFSRRQMVAGGIGATALLAGGTVAVVYHNRQADIDKLIERGRILQSSGQPEGQAKAEALFRKAIALDRNRADAWGWLSVALIEPSAQRDAAHRAIALDPKEPNARTILASQRQDLDDWVEWEETLLKVLDDAPDNALALDQITLFYQAMGRCKDSLQTNERAIAIEPFNPSHHARRALKHWIFGKVGNADKVADRALRLWPSDPLVWNARVLIYAFTDRGPAALSILDDRQSRPRDITSVSIASWQAALTAISSRRRSDIDRALKVCADAAKLAPGLAANAIMVFSYLDELDAAYQIAQGLFESKGPAIQKTRGSGIRDAYSGPDWGRTQFLFIPATRAFRDDPRFPALCRQMGHVDYWRARGIWPDPFVRGALIPAKLI